MTKTLFDVEKSLKECPPTEIYKSTRGYKFKKRIVTRVDKIIPKKDNQIRVHLVQQKNASEITSQLSVSGWLHDRPPIIVSVNQDNPELFDLEMGFTRYQAINELNWETILVDVVEPTHTPLETFSEKFLNNKHLGKAHTRNTCEDITHGLARAVRDKMLPDLHDQSLSDTQKQKVIEKIKEWIKYVTPDKSENERKKIYKDYLAITTNIGPVRTWHQGSGLNSIKEYAIANNLPYGGEKNYEASGKLAYATHYKDLGTIISDCKNLLRKYNYEVPVNIVPFIEEPKPAPELYRQRESWLKTANDQLDNEAQWIMEIAEKAGAKILKNERPLYLNEIRKQLGIHIGGFWFQNIESDSLNQGKQKETGIVDVEGKPFTLK